METLFLMSQVVKSYKRNIQSLEEKKKKHIKEKKIQ